MKAVKSPILNNRKRLVCAFGRFNPPTWGHVALATSVERLAAILKADARIFVSKSHDVKRNPIDPETKLDLLRSSLVTSVPIGPALQMPPTVFDWAWENGYGRVHMVVGADRAASMRQCVKNYMKARKEHGLPTGHITILTVKRLKMFGSASLMRSAVAKGDYKAFTKIAPKTDVETVERIWRETARGMGVERKRGDISAKLSTRVGRS
jgi:hypothetical protein